MTVATMQIALQSHKDKNNGEKPDIVTCSQKYYDFLLSKEPTQFDLSVIRRNILYFEVTILVLVDYTLSGENIKFYKYSIW